MAKIELNYNARLANGVLYHTAYGGFFSCLSTCLWNLVKLYYKHGILPERLDFSHTLRNFKTEQQNQRSDDIYPELFHLRPMPSDVRPGFMRRPVCDHHRFYKARHLALLRPLVHAYFSPADSILAIQADLCRKYAIEPTQTLGVCLRGTDKSTELQNAPVEHYARKCEAILNANPGLRLWVQTDQAQYRDYFCSRFPKQSFFIEELPVTSGQIAIHNEPLTNIDRLVFSKTFLAAIHLLSGCHTVVTHTGNVGYWLALYRTTLANFYQDIHPFHPTGHLKTEYFDCDVQIPGKPRIWRW